MDLHIRINIIIRKDTKKCPSFFDVKLIWFYAKLLSNVNAYALLSNVRISFFRCYHTILYTAGTCVYSCTATATIPYYTQQSHVCTAVQQLLPCHTIHSSHMCVRLYSSCYHACHTIHSSHMCVQLYCNCYHGRLYTAVTCVYAWYQLMCGYYYTSKL